MSVSLQSQLTALRVVHELRTDQLVRAGVAKNRAQAELLHDQLQAAYTTFCLVASDERIRRYVEKIIKP